jgi:hypothetical protein
MSDKPTKKYIDKYIENIEKERKIKIGLYNEFGKKNKKLLKENPQKYSHNQMEYVERGVRNKMRKTKKSLLNILR